MEENKQKTKYFDANLIDGKRLSYKLQSSIMGMTWLWVLIYITNENIDWELNNQQNCKNSFTTNIVLS